MPSAEFKEWWKRFRVTGDICPVQLGMTRDELNAILGEPDDVSTMSRKERVPAIWKYDDLEFHFEHGSNGTLWLIFREVDNIVQTSISIVYAKEPRR
jgi:hypothetical protein